MPRPRLGQAAKDHPVTVRLTESEKNMLAKAYGSPSNGLRRILDTWKTQAKEQK